MATPLNINWETIKSWIKQYPFIFSAILAYVATQNVMLVIIFVLMQILLS